MEKFSVVRREPIYDGKRISLSLYDLQTPDGVEIRKEVVIHPGAVGIIALDADDRLVLVRQYRAAADRILLEIPAGTLEHGEDPVECAVRELQEETNYKPNTITPFGGIYVAPGYLTEYIHLFLATDLVESLLPPDAGELIEVVKLSLDEALDRIDTGEICDGKSTTAILRLWRIRQTHP